MLREFQSADRSPLFIARGRCGVLVGLDDDGDLQVFFDGDGDIMAQVFLEDASCLEFVDYRYGAGGGGIS